MKTIKLLTLLALIHFAMHSCKKDNDIIYDYTPAAYGLEFEVGAALPVPKEGGTYKLSTFFFNPSATAPEYHNLEFHKQYNDLALYVWQITSYSIFDNDGIEKWYADNPNVDRNSTHEMPIDLFNIGTEEFNYDVIDVNTRFVKPKPANLSSDQTYEHRAYANTGKSEFFSYEIHRDPNLNPLNDYVLLTIKPNNTGKEILMNIGCQGKSLSYIQKK